MLVRVLLLTNIFPSHANPQGGSFIRSRATALAAAGVGVDVVAIGGIPSGRADLRPAGTEFIDGTVDVARFQRGLARARGRSHKAETMSAGRIQQLLDITGYDGIMAHGMFSVAAGRVAAELAGVADTPFTVHLHGSDINLLMARRPRAFVSTLHTAARAVFVSNALMERAIELGYNARNGVVIPNGVDTSVFFPRDRALDASMGDPAVCFVGNLIPVKGADRLPSVFSRLLAHAPKATMTIVGDGPLRARLERDFRGQQVTFTGRLPASGVASVLGRSDVLLIPSRSEGWPTVINESYATGTPVVATAVGGIPEAVAERFHLVEDGDNLPERLARAVLNVVRLRNRTKLIEHAHQFSWESVVKRELRALNG